MIQRSITRLIAISVSLICVVQAVTIKYQQYGPDIMSPNGMAAVALIDPTPISPVPSTAPIIRIGLGLDRTGPPLDVAYVADYGVDNMISLLVDYTNTYGGIWMNGTQYRMSVYIADHQSSTELTQLIYQDMVETQGIKLLLGPYGEQLQSAISPIIVNLNASLVSAVAFDPASFPSTSTNVYGLFPSPQYYHVNTLNAINTNAVAYFYNNRVGSKFGITSVCLFGFDDSLSIQLRSGIIGWIESENAYRRSQGAASNELITMLVHRSLTNTTSTTNNYLSYWMMCPDQTDLVVMPIAANAVASLTQSNRRFKAVLSLDHGDEFFAAPASVIHDAAGWIISVHFLGSSSSTVSRRKTIFVVPSLDDGLLLYNTYVSGDPAMVTASALSIFAVARVAELVTLITALNVSQSIDRDDVRVGFMSLNDHVSAFGPLEFNATTGLNTGDGQGNSIPLQCLGEPRESNTSTSNQLQVLMYSLSLSYPFDWSWRPHQRGDQLIVEQNPLPIFIGWITAALGAWLAQILLEHAMFIRQPKRSRRSSISVSAHSASKPKWDKEYLLWLSLAAQSLGGIGITASQLFQSTALTTHLDEGSSALALTWAPLRSTLAWFVAVVLTFAAIVIMVETHITRPHNKPGPVARFRSTTEASMSGVSGISSATSAAGVRASQRQLRSQTEMSRRRQQLEARPSNQRLANTTYRQEIFGIIEAMQHWRIAAAAFCIVSAVTLSRLIVVSAWQQQANFHWSSWSWPVTVILDWIVVPFAFVGFKYSIKLRVPCIILIVLAFGFDWQLGVLSMFFTYDPTLTFQYEWATLHIVSILVGIAAALVFLLFLGMQFNRMRISHKDLLLLIRTQEKAIADGMNRERVLNGRLVDCEDRVSALLATIDCISLVSTAPFHFVLPLAMFNNVVRTTNVEEVQTARLRGNSSMEQFVEPVAPKTEPPSLAGSLAGSGVISTMMNAVGLNLSGSLSRSMKVSPVVAMEKPLAPPRLFSDSSHNLLDEPAEESILEAIESQMDEKTRMRAPFELTASILGADMVPRARLELGELLEHPACIEIFKQTLQQFHSLENLTFYLIARKYRTLTDTKLRRLVALQIVDHFIREGSEQQINISTAHRSAILDVCSASTGTIMRSLRQLSLIRRNEQAEMFGANLFLDAEREVLMLMDSNMFSRFEKTPSYRLCCWVHGALNTQQVSSSWMLRKPELHAKSSITAGQSSL